MWWSVTWRPIERTKKLSRKPLLRVGESSARDRRRNPCGMGYTGSFTCGEAKSDELLKDQAAIGAVLTPLCSAQLLAETFYPRDLEETNTQDQRE